VATLDEYLLRIEHEGLSVSKGQLRSQAFAEMVEEHGSLASRLALSGTVPSLLERGQQRATLLADQKLFQQYASFVDTYKKGEALTIEGYLFHLPGESEQVLISGPVTNNIGNGTVLSSVPLGAAGTLTGSKALQKLAKGAIPLGMSLKLFEKAYKEAKKEKRDFKKIFKFGGAGVGGVVVASGAMLGEHPLLKYIVNPLVAGYMGMSSGVFQKLLKRGTTLHEPMPPVHETGADLARQAGRYAAVKSQYAERPLMDREQLPELVREVNGSLRFHLESVKPADIDIDLDVLLSRIYPLLDEGASVPNKITQTVEFAWQALGELTPEEIAHDYITSALFIDSEENMGRIRQRADRVLEDLAVSFPGKGYDLQLERSRLESVAFAYASQLAMEKDALRKELEKKGVSSEIAALTLSRLHPAAPNLALEKLQRMLGNEDPQGYTTHYRLSRGKDFR